MTLSANGMKNAIVSALADPMIDGMTKDEALDAASGELCLTAMSEAIIDALTGGSVTMAFRMSNAVCGNTPMTPTGPYSAIIEARDTSGSSTSDNNKIDGLSDTDLRDQIRINIARDVDGVSIGDFTNSAHWENARHCTEAIAEAVVEHIHDRARIRIDTGTPGIYRTAITGTALAQAPVSGVSPSSISCDIVNLSATALGGAIEAKIDAKVAEADFDKANARANIGAIASGIVSHIHAEAVVDVDISLRNVFCPVGGGTSSGDAEAASTTSIS